MRKPPFNLNRNQFALSILFAFALLLTLAFQNCTFQNNVAFKSASPHQASLSSGGNGEPYEGKPEDTFYQLDPDFRCDGKKAIKSTIEVKGEHAVAYSTNPHDCTKSPTSLKTVDLETWNTSAGNWLGYAEGIYQKFESAPQPESEDPLITQTWCQAPVAGDTTSNIVILGRQSNLQLSAAFSSGQSNTSIATANDVQLTVSGTTATYTSQSFTLTLELNNYVGVKTEKVTGRMSRTGKAPEPVACRTQLLPRLSCPVNFVSVPASAPFTTRDFCVAKYEMKSPTGSASGGSLVESRAHSLPLANINRQDAVSACQSLGQGYDLVRNKEWMTIARNIESVGWNWSAGVVGSPSGLSRSAGAYSLVEADVDEAPCSGTVSTCSLTQWNEFRRVHRLPNGNLIWDFAGNADEWIKDDSSLSWWQYEKWNSSIDDYMASVFGPDSYYGLTASIPGFGEILSNSTQGAVSRGGNGEFAPEPLTAGIYTVKPNRQPADTSETLGFRCVFRPRPEPQQTIFGENWIPQDPICTDTTPIEVGTRFRSSRPGSIVAVRFYRGISNPDGYEVHVWSDTGDLLATATAQDGLIPGWQEVPLQVPVPIQANKDYVVSYYSSNGQPGEHVSGMSFGFSNGLDLSVAGEPNPGGVYVFQSGFPDQVASATNYFVDLVFERR